MKSNKTILASICICIVFTLTYLTACDMTPSFTYKGGRCSSPDCYIEPESDGDTDTIPPLDGDIELPLPDGDINESGFDVDPDPDPEPDVEEPSSFVCQPPCHTASGYYCDQETENCEIMPGQYCMMPTQCDPGESCEHFDNQECSICVAHCSGQNPACPAGYECNTEEGLCAPLATWQGCPNICRTLNDQCFQQDGDRACPDGQQCAGHPDSYGGICAESCGQSSCCGDARCMYLSGKHLCLKRCTADEDCGILLDCHDTAGEDKPVCLHWSMLVPRGHLPLNAKCNMSDDECSFGSICKPANDGNRCMSLCGAPNYFDCPGTQECIPLDDLKVGYCKETLTRGLGELCIENGGINSTYFCKSFDGDLPLTCKTMSPYEEPFTPDMHCDTIDDCPLRHFPAGRRCIHPGTDDSYCLSSFCSTPCASQRSCDHIRNSNYLWEPYTTQDGCYCYPTGSNAGGMPGEACPYGIVNSGAAPCRDDYLGREMVCMGISPDTLESYQREPCFGPDDCSPDYPGNPACVELPNGDSYCGSSFCASACDENRSCEYLSDLGNTWQTMTIGNKCYCFPFYNQP